MTDTARRYQAGYRNPITNKWVRGISEDPNVDPGYYDLELEIWVEGIPDISSGEWIPEQAILATDRECPSTFPVKGNLPSHVYHLPNDPTYEHTIPEICFAGADAAMMAGFRPSRARRRNGWPEQRCAIPTMADGDQGLRQDNRGEAGIWTASGPGTERATGPAEIRVLARPTDADGGYREIPFSSLERNIAERSTIWVDINLPDPAAASLLADVFRLGPLTVEDCLTPPRMPKFDPLPDGSAFVAVFAMRLARVSAPRLQATALTLVVGSTYLVTLSRDRVPEVVARIESVLAAGGNVATLTGAGLAHAALDALVDRHLPVTLQAAEVAEDLEEALDPQADRRGLTALERLIVLRRDLLAFRRLAVAQQEVLRRVGRSFAEVQAQFSDVADNQCEAIDTAAATCDYIDGAIEAYRVRRDAQTEDGIRRLSVLAGVFLPVSLLIALWGINFPNIPGTDAAWGWPVFVLVQIALILIGAWYFRRHGML